ncbi:hypothetical protein NPIL_660881 [Nephila pilipes]|uniref:Uncharacterized protein n=1 Tax=Nephila pilipes TaxID=299642 RepID=A0A8X6TL21_NEPPI|nr:hypothetical protein NPIL_660881 [Nephila pilipes]
MTTAHCHDTFNSFDHPTDHQNGLRGDAFLLQHPGSPSGCHKDLSSPGEVTCPGTCFTWMTLESFLGVRGSSTIFPGREDGRKGTQKNLPPLLGAENTKSTLQSPGQPLQVKCSGKVHKMASEIADN